MVLVIRRSLSLARRRCFAFGLLLVLGSIGIHLVLTVLLDKSGQVLNGPRARVLNRRVLGTSGEQLNGGEASNRVRNVVRSRIDLGDGNLRAKITAIEGSELVVLRGKTISK